MVATADRLKKRAAEKAVELIRSGMIVGLGTGSTAAHAVSAIAGKLQSGELNGILGIPTSAQTEEQARRLEVPLTTLEEHPEVDITIDGADQVDPAGNLIKGGGGALLREKIVATASAKYAIVVDDSKLVKILGDGFSLPVEVVTFGWKTSFRTIRDLGAEPTLRLSNGDPFRTDEGHYIVDCTFDGGMSDPVDVDAMLRALPVVVETGLFLGMNPEVIVGRA